MKSTPTQLWNAWRTSTELRETAEAWITKPESDWTEDHERLQGMIRSAPEEALATMLGIMQMTDEPRLLNGLAAGPLEDFLGVHGEAYMDTIHTLALEHRRLREVLDGVWQGAMPKRVWRRVELLKQSAFS